MGRLNVLGFDVYKGYLDFAYQQRVLDAVRDVVRDAPLLQPVTPGGRPMSVKMTAAGSFGWVSDTRGYRYTEQHPSGADWPDIPLPVLDIWKDVSGATRLPECCLVNYYSEGAKMGLHQDKDEASFEWPVVSISLGDDALFRMGGQARTDKTQSLWLQSGDVVVMGGKARQSYHGVSRTRFASSRLIPRGGRINLTLRVVSA